eukprot:53860_1
MEVINSSISPQCAEGHSEIHSCQSVNPTPGGPHVTSDTSSATRNHNSNSNNEINEHGKRALNDPNDHNPQPPKRQRTESHHQELLYTTPEFIRAICEGGKTMTVMTQMTLCWLDWMQLIQEIGYIIINGGGYHI